MIRNLSLNCASYSNASLNYGSMSCGSTIPNSMSLNDSTNCAMNSNDWTMNGCSIPNCLMNYGNSNCGCCCASLSYDLMTPSCWNLSGWKNCDYCLNAKNCYGCSTPSCWSCCGSKNCESWNCESCLSDSNLQNYLKMNGSKKNGLMISSYWSCCDYCWNGWNSNDCSNYDSTIRNWTNCCVTNCYDWTKPNLKSCYGSTKNGNWKQNCCWNCDCSNYGSTNYGNYCYAKKMNANLTAAFPKNYYLNGSMIRNLTNSNGSMTSDWNSNANYWTPNCLNLNDCCSNGWMNFGSKNCDWKILNLKNLNASYLSAMMNCDSNCYETTILSCCWNCETSCYGNLSYGWSLNVNSILRSYCCYAKNSNESLSYGNLTPQYPMSCCCYEKMRPNCWNLNGCSNYDSMNCAMSLNGWNLPSWNLSCDCCSNGSKSCVMTNSIPHKRQ